jgi:hypothetical protein
MRFTEVHDLLEELMKLLIEIFYIEEAKDKMVDWWEDDSLKLLEQLFGKVFGKCAYNNRLRKFSTYLPAGDKGPFFKINEDDRLVFCNIMRLLASDIEDGIVRHFDLIGIDSQVTSNFCDPADKTQTPFLFPQSPYTPHFLTGESRKEIRRLKDKALPVLKGEAKRKTGGIDIDRTEYTKMKILMVKYREPQDNESGRIKSYPSEFAELLLNAEPREEPIVNIPVIHWPHIIFIGLVRSILVHFHVAFDDYSRLKVCQYDKCGHIYFEKKKRSSYYCNKKCKMAAHRQSEPPEIFLCRGRQNKWITGNEKNKSNIQKDHCKGCTLNSVKKVKWGKCPLIPLSVDERDEAKQVNASVGGHETQQDDRRSD